MCLHATKNRPKMRSTFGETSKPGAPAGSQAPRANRCFGRWSPGWFAMDDLGVSSNNHKPPIWQWFLQPICGDLRMVYRCFNHITPILGNLHEDEKMPKISHIRKPCSQYIVKLLIPVTPVVVSFWFVKFYLRSLVLGIVCRILYQTSLPAVILTPLRRWLYS